MNYTFTNNWREKVASMTEIDDIDIEKTFSDMASGFVANKVGDLMKDEHRIGFEIVKKNDDNTKLLGVFAFKVDKELIFAPVFFLQGEIKGPLLYRCDTKQFLPATKEWASYLIESIETSDGRGISRNRISETAPMVDMDKIMMRPKQASASESNAMRLGLPVSDYERIKAKSIKAVKEQKDSDKLTDAEFNKQVEEKFNTEYAKTPASIKKAFTLEFGENVEDGMLDAIAKSAAFTPGILKEFLSEPGYGLAAAESIVKLAGDSSGVKTLEHIAELYGDASQLIPDMLQDFEKKASDPHNLEVHFELTKEAAKYPKQYFKDGFFLFDNRYKKDCCEVIKEPARSVLTSVTDMGVYDLLKEDGNFEDDVFCAHILSYQDCCSSQHKKALHWFDSPKSNTNRIIAINKDGKASIYEKVLGIQTSNANINNDENKLPGTDSISEGKVYVAYYPGVDSVSAPFLVKNIKSVDDVKFCNVDFLDSEVLHTSSREKAIAWPHSEGSCKIIINKDAKSNHEKGVYGGDVKFIKLKATVGSYDSLATAYDDKRVEISRIQNIADADQANVWMFEKFKSPTINVSFDKEASDSFKYRVHDVNEGSSSVRMNKFQVLTKLARDLKINATEAYDIVISAENNGSCEFGLAGFEKLASRIHIVGAPQFTEEFDQTTGIPVVENQSFVLDTAAEQQYDNRPHVGDAMNPTTATGLPTITILNTAPDQLRQVADMYNLPNVFEHGAVGVLADTFDANQLLYKYIPKILEAVDSLGRIKFLYYWKPEDFQKSYGADDMVNLEAEINTNFEQLGDLGLKLQKKSDKQKRGESVSSQDLD